jgi:hypothetical protein
MTVRREIEESPGEVHGAKNNERHACGRRRDGEPAVSWRAEPRRREADLKQSVDRPSGEPARQHAAAACWLVAAVNPQLQQKCS